MARTRHLIAVSTLGVVSAAAAVAQGITTAHRSSTRPDVQQQTSPVQHRRGTDRACLVALAHDDVPASYVRHQAEHWLALAEELEQHVPEGQRGGYAVSLTGRITLYVVGELNPLPAVVEENPQVVVERVERTRHDVERASALAWGHVPGELSTGVLADWFDPELNGLRVEVAPWWEGTAAQLARHLGVPVEVAVHAPLEVAHRSIA